MLLATDPLLDREVALKIPRPDAITTPELKKRFVREGKAVAALAHPNIVPLFESGQFGSFVCLASEYVDGTTLSDWRKENSNLSFTQIAEICQCIAEAVAHAHQRGVIHRDIKPSNISGRSRLVGVIERADKDYRFWFGKKCK